MRYVFKSAVRDNVHLILGFVGGTGAGKTLSAMKVATGIVGRDNKFAVIDAERGRARHYAPRANEKPDYIHTFNFDVLDIEPPFRPNVYKEAVMAAEAAGYGAIVVDSTSHVWDGEGGCLEWHDEIVDEIVERKKEYAEKKGWKFDEAKTRDAANLSAWNEPKSGRDGHKQMVQKMLQVNAHLLLCFRAEEKIEIGKDKDGKTEVRPKKSITGLNGWTPICEKKLPYELTSSLLFTADAPGIPKPIKLQEQHRKIFSLDRVVDEESGRKIAEWAAGGSKTVSAPPAQSEPVSLDNFKFALDSCDTVDELKSTWKDYETRISKTDLIEAQKAYKDQLAKIKAATTAASQTE